MDVTTRRLAGLFVVGLLGFFPPGIGAPNQPLTVFGLPLLPLYLFAFWGALVAAAWAAVRRRRR